MTRTISVDFIAAEQGSLVSQVRSALPNILNAARADGVTTLYIETTPFSNGGLRRFLETTTRSIGGTFDTVGGSHYMTFTF